MNFTKRFPPNGDRDIKKVIANKDDVGFALFVGETYLGITTHANIKDQSGSFQCKGKIYGIYHFVQCQHRGKHQEAGHWWCGHHAPTRVLRKAVLRHWKREDKWKALTKRITDSETWEKTRDAVVQAARDCSNQKASFDNLMLATEKLIDLEREHDAQKSN